VKEPNGTLFDVGQVSPFFSMNDFEDFCKSITKSMEQVWVHDFIGAAIAGMATWISLVVFVPKM
jgi:hypothetical protein